MQIPGRKKLWSCRNIRVSFTRSPLMQAPELAPAQKMPLSHHPKHRHPQKYGRSSLQDQGLIFLQAHWPSLQVDVPLFSVFEWLLLLISSPFMQTGLLYLSLVTDPVWVTVDSLVSQSAPTSCTMQPVMFSAPRILAENVYHNNEKFGLNLLSTTVNFRLLCRGSGLCRASRPCAALFVQGCLLKMVVGTVGSEGKITSAPNHHQQGIE